MQKKSLVTSSISQRRTRRRRPSAIASFGMVYRICARAETDQAENCQFSLVKFVCLCTTRWPVVRSSTLSPDYVRLHTAQPCAESLNTRQSVRHSRALCRMLGERTCASSGSALETLESELGRSNLSRFCRINVCSRVAEDNWPQLCKNDPKLAKL